MLRPPWLADVQNFCAFVIRTCRPDGLVRAVRHAKIRLCSETSRILALMPFTPKRVGSVAYSLVMFVVVSVLSGVLIAGLFVPMAGIAGVSSKAAAEEMDNIEAALATPAPPTRSRVLMADGKLLAYFYDENRIYVPLDKIAPIMRQAQMAIEDHRFYEHGALDVKGTLRALVRNTVRGRQHPGRLLASPSST